MRDWRSGSLGHSTSNATPVTTQPEGTSVPWSSTHRKSTEIDSTASRWASKSSRWTLTVGLPWSASVRSSDGLLTGHLDRTLGAVGCGSPTLATHTERGAQLRGVANEVVVCLRGVDDDQATPLGREGCLDVLGSEPAESVPVLDQMVVTVLSLSKVRNLRRWPFNAEPTSVLTWSTE